MGGGSNGVGGDSVTGVGLWCGGVAGEGVCGISIRFVRVPSVLGGEF